MKILYIDIIKTAYKFCHHTLLLYIMYTLYINIVFYLWNQVVFERFFKYSRVTCLIWNVPATNIFHFIDPRLAR